MELKIYDDIVDEETKVMYQWCGMDGVCFKDIDTFISSIPTDDNSIHIKLKCRGGDVAEGWAMYDALRASGKKISAEVIEAASMGSIILLAAEKGERKAHPNAKLLIHDPYIPEYTLSGAYTADDLRNLADDLHRESEKILNVYVERTGGDRAELEALMKKNEYIDMNRAKELGFISTILAPKSAKSFKKQIKNYAMKEDVKKAFKTLGVALGVISEKIVGLELQTENGETLTIERESGDPQVGDTASPDGEFVMPDGSTIIVTEGVITEIKPAEEEESTEEELAQAQSRIQELEAQLATAQALAKSKEDLEILNAVRIAGGKEWLAQAKSNYTVQGRKQSINSQQKENKTGNGSLREYVNAKKDKK